MKDIKNALRQTASKNMFYNRHKKFQKKTLIILIGIIISISSLPAVFATDNSNDMLFYRGGGATQIPEYRTRNQSGFSSESTALNINSAIQYTKVVSKPGHTSTEKIACTSDIASDINCQVFNGSSWGNLLEVSSSAGTNKGFDVAYETVSGRGIVCYRTTSPNNQTPACRIWNGSFWETEINGTSVGAIIQNIRLIPSPSSNYIAMMIKDNSDDISAQIWNGSSWTNFLEVSTNGGGCTQCLSYDGAWESTSDAFMANWFDDATDSIFGRKFNKTTLWGSQINNIITGLSTSDNVYVESDSNPQPASNEILTAAIDDDNTLNFNYWDGIAWQTPTELSANINGAVAVDNHLFDLAFEHAQDFDALLTYGSTATSLKYRIWDSASKTWSAEAALPTPGQSIDWHQLAADSNSQKIMLTTVGTINQINTLEWNGSAWEASWTLHESSSNDQFWNAWYSYDDEDENNHPPEITFNSANQKTNASGLVDISIDVADDGLDKAKIQIQYSTGETCQSPWTNATLSGPATANFNDIGGAPDINNNQTYQIGSGTDTKVITSSGTNTVQFDWNSQADLPNGDGTYCLRAIGNDTIADSNVTATTTVLIDNTIPTKLADFRSTGTAATTQHLEWTPATETNFNHYEIWYGTNQSDVINRTGSAIEWDDDDFLALNTKTTHHTHITNLTPATTYYYKIWAVDDFGNEQTVADILETTDIAGNTPPIATAPTGISQATDGSGLVTFTTTIHDEDLEETLMRLRFSSDGGNIFYNAQIDSVIADHGTTSIDVNDFQIGKTNHIDTGFESPENITLTIVWDSKSSSNQNGGLNGTSTNVILQVTPRDASDEIGIDYNSAPFLLDNAGAVLAQSGQFATSTNDTTPNFSFTSTATGTISYTGACSSATANAVIGTNTITFNTFVQGTYNNCSLSVTDSFNNISNSLSIPTFIVDTTPPSGLNTLNVGTTTQISQTLNWSSVSETNFNHYEIWYGTNQSDVINRTGSAIEWNTDNDPLLSSRTTNNTTITGLTHNTSYYYKIWASDTAGNESTVSDINNSTPANNPPTGIFNSAQQAHIESLEVDVSIEVNDPDGNKTKAKIEYETDLDGLCNGPWTKATLSGPVTVDFNDTGGDPDINNSQTYQIGSGTNTKIITESGSNTVQFEWDAGTDLSSANGQTACLRLTVNDDTDSQAILATTTLLVDNIPPQVSTTHIVSTLITDQNTANIAGIGDVIRFTWNNSATGDNNPDISTVTINLISFGGLANQTMYDDGTHGDQTSNDDVYTYEYTITPAAIDNANAHPHVIATGTHNNQTETPDDENISTDAESPSAPSNLGISSATNGTVILRYGQASNISDFSAYKIFYKEGLSGVTVADTQHTSPDLNYQNYNNRTDTTISSLDRSKTYAFNIWVFDDAGHSANATEINTSPNGSTHIVGISQIPYTSSVSNFAPQSSNNISINSTQLINQTASSIRPQTATSTQINQQQITLPYSRATMFNKSLSFGIVHNDVLKLQQFLNKSIDTLVAKNGPGAPGQETNYFGRLTRTAVQKFQEIHKIADKNDRGFGIFGPKTRAKLNELLQN